MLKLLLPKTTKLCTLHRSWQNLFILTHLLCFEAGTEPAIKKLKALAESQVFTVYLA